MHWLPDDMNGDLSRHQTALKVQPTPTSKPKYHHPIADGVKYIPPQMDPLAGATVAAARQDPIRLMIEDTVVLLRLWRYLPNLLAPFFTKEKDAELYMDLANVKVGSLQILLALMQTLFMVLVIPAFLSLPGGAFFAATALFCLACYLITLPMAGPPINFSNMDSGTRALAEQHKNERWILVNGVCTGHSTLQLEIDRLSKIFGRAVIGIHNKSHGIIADLGMCLIQRAVSYHDYSTRLTYAYVKAMLVDPTVTKVILIGHSQGGIIVSQTIDDLLSQLPAETMSKLEVYTFGSAASHFSNPSFTLSSKPSHQPSEQRSLKESQLKVHIADTDQTNHVIPHMEHYANEYDLVPRWGVLHSVQDVLDTRYAGSIFVRMGASGHMFNQHYIDPIFSQSNSQKDATKRKKNVKWKTARGLASNDEYPIEENLGESFLDQIVTTDEGLALQRQSTILAEMGVMRVMRRESGLEFGSGQVLTDCDDANGDGGLTFFRIVAEEAKDKTVKDLSRLWKYLGGKSPVDYDGNQTGSQDEQHPEHRKKRHGHHDQRKADHKSGERLLG